MGTRVKEGDRSGDLLILLAGKKGLNGIIVGTQGINDRMGILWSVPLTHNH